MNLSSIIAARHRATAGFSTEAQSYFDRLDTAGDTTYTPYKQPLANYIDGLVAEGGAYWNTMLSACSFVGVGIEGIVVPLRSGMTVPTNNNFISTDLNQVTGLLGDGTSYIHMNLTDSAVSQNDASLSCWVNSAASTLTGMVGSSALRIDSDITPATGVRLYSQTTSRDLVSFTQGSFVGHSRTVGTEYDYLVTGSSGTLTRASTAPAAGAMTVFARVTFANTDARLATYHFGPALNLATLEALQDTLLTEIAAI